MQLAKVLGAVGRVFITAGVLILLFVAYQLWGTGIREAQAQRALEDEFEQRVGDADVDEPDETTTTTGGEDPGGGPAPTSEAAPPPPPPADGDAVARLRIPAIGLDKIVVEGVEVSDLKKGPGHYPSSPLPGQPGNAAIAGHRTTYGAPFNRLDELEAGDEIMVTTVQGSFRYEVREQLIVEPDQVEVLDDFGDDRLTLTACHPKYSARQRIVIVAALQGTAAPAPETPPPSTAPEDVSPGGDVPPGGDVSPGDEEASPETIDAGLGGERASAWPAVLLALACALIWVAAWLLGRLWRKWPAYAVCLPLFLVVLFFFFEDFSRLLPANF
ncbi:MAG TPA: class E sortase [Acidimicrobiales bacterium]|nr:class E sortase [Acidimicrobiales bacterium]